MPLHEEERTPPPSSWESPPAGRGQSPRRLQIWYDYIDKRKIPKGRRRELEEATRLPDMAVEKYAKDQSKLSAWVQDNIPEGLTVFAFPEHLRKKLRTNNIEERLNRSIKARTRLVSVFPNQASQLRLVSAICMEISDEWETGTVYLNVKEL